MLFFFFDFFDFFCKLIIVEDGRTNFVNSWIQIHYISSFVNFIFFSVACNDKTGNLQSNWTQTSFKKSGLSVACTRAIKTLDNEIHGITFLGSNGKHFDKSAINNFLYSISLLDDFTQDNTKKI